MENKEGERNWTGFGETPKERVKSLVQGLLDENTSPELYGKLLDWFRSDVSDAEKYEVFMELAAQLKPDSNAPTTELRKKYAEVAERLGLNTEREKQTPEKKKPAYKIIWRMAAVIIPFVVLLGAGYWLGKTSTATPGVDPEGIVEHPALVVAAVEGVQKDIVLPDSSKVWINSGSKLTANAEGAGKRSVALEGEAFFDVERDEQRPFVVHTKHLDVRVLGTKFDVKAYPNEKLTEVILHEGSVEVVAGEKAMVLKPNEKLTYYHESSEMKVETLARLSDWRTEVVFIQRKTLADIFLMVENYYEMEIAFDANMLSNELHSVPIGKAFTIEQVMLSLSKISGDFTYRIDKENNRVEIIKD